MGRYKVPLEAQFELLARIKLQQCLPVLAERQQCMKIRFVAYSILLLRGAPQHVFEMLFEREVRLIPELVDMLKRADGKADGVDPLPQFLYISGFRTLHAFVQASCALLA